MGEKKNPETCMVTGFFDSGDGGIRTHVPKKDNRISSAARYDHFDTSPCKVFLAIIAKKQNKANRF